MNNNQDPAQTKITVRNNSKKKECNNNIGFPVRSAIKNLPAVLETWVQSMQWEDSQEKEMAGHSSILAWEVPWTKQPDRPQSPGLLRSLGSQGQDLVI